MEQYMGIIWIVGIGAVMYFMTIRPQRKQQKERNSMMEALKKGDRVITVGGFYGIIRAINEQRITLEIANEIYVQVTKAAIGNVISKDVKAERVVTPDILDDDEFDDDDMDYEIEQDDE